MFSVHVVIYQIDVKLKDYLCVSLVVMDCSKMDNIMMADDDCYDIYPQSTDLPFYVTWMM